MAKTEKQMITDALAKASEEQLLARLKELEGGQEVVASTTKSPAKSKRM